ncbi:MAG: SLC13 family permease [Trueperaceae bacterium]
MEPLSSDAWIALGVAVVTLAGVAFGRLPYVPLDRAGFALVGAAALLAGGVLDLHAAAALVDAEVLVLLFGLMLLNEALAEAGAFRALTRWATRRATSPFALLVALTFAAGTLSALFLNDTIALMLTPLVVATARALGVRTLPYLLALATAANVGSVATVTGNPQNLIVAVRGGIGFVPFAAALAPVALVGLAVVVAVIAVVHRRDLFGVRFAAAAPPAAPPAPRRPLAMASTLAGNLTLFGSVTNLIVAEGARRAGERVGFGAYLRVGVPITLATLLLGATWLAFGPFD